MEKAARSVHDGFAATAGLDAKWDLLEELLSLTCDPDVEQRSHQVLQFFTNPDEADAVISLAKRIKRRSREDRNRQVGMQSVVRRLTKYVIVPRKHSLSSFAYSTEQSSSRSAGKKPVAPVVGPRRVLVLLLAPRPACTG